MNPVNYLRGREDEPSAEQIAKACGLSLTATYAQLVAAEARGLVRVVVSYDRRKTPRRIFWEACE